MSYKDIKKDSEDHTLHIAAANPNAISLTECWKSEDTTFNDNYAPELVTFIDIKREIFEEDGPVLDSLGKITEMKPQCELKEVLRDLIIKQEAETRCLEVSTLIKSEEFHMKSENHNSNSPRMFENVSRSYLATKTSHEANYQCSKCAFQTPYKTMLSSHMLRHKDDLKPSLFACSVCSYKAAEKRNLMKHFRRHEKARKNDAIDGPKSELPLLNITGVETKNHRCSQCEYRTGQFYNLKIHILRYHETLKDSDILKCTKCIYQTLRSNDLKKHMSEHESLNENKLLKCTESAECEYQTFSKRSLAKHLLRHSKRVKEVPLYQCVECPYHTKDRSNMRHHLLRHKTTDESGGYICHDCGFTSKYKQVLKRHIVSNKLDQIFVNKCRFCDFQTRYKCVLKKHSVCHKLDSCLVPF